MQSIEIRYKRKIVFLMLAALFIALLVMVYYIYMSGTFEENQHIKMIYALLAVALLFTLYTVFRGVLKNKPVLVFTEKALKINFGKPVSFLWIQIINWKIEKDDNTSYLLIETINTKKKVNISWLEKKPAEIEALMQEYRKQ